ncbi:MAG: ABC transporter permease subunit [Gemmatimonadales bacterium]|nr:ABC transporter permease subunit [Gemmatimonadales bacterium]
MFYQLNHIFRFELQYRLRQPAFYVFSVLFFFMTFMATSTDSVQIGGGIGNVARNAPFIIAQTLNGMGLFAVIFIAILMSTVVSRDKDLGTLEILHSTPLAKFPLLLGRFTATILLSVASASFAGLGIALASFMPYQTAEHIQAFSLLPYLHTLFFFVLPNCLLGGALFFSVSVLTGRAMTTYVAMIAFFALYGFAFSFLGDLQNENLATLLDPFGLASLDLMTRYWTIVERNTLLPPITGVVLLNRLLWLTVAGVLLVFTFFRFRMGLGSAKGTERTTDLDNSTPSVFAAPATETIPALAPSFTAHTALSQWFSLAKLESRTLLRSLPFLVLMLFGLFNLSGILLAELDGRFLYPVTHRMLRVIAGGFDQFLLILIVFYSAELVWRDKKHRFHEIQGSLPVPSWTLLTAKFSALTAVILVSLSLAMALTIGFQLFKGFHHLEPGLYFRGLFIMSFSEWLLLAVIAIFTQVIGRQRYIGFFLMLLYFLVNTFGPEMGMEHRLFFYRSTPAVIYSDMNGYGHFTDASIWFKIFWVLLAVIMLTLAARLWPRGSQDSLWPALRNLPSRWRPVHTTIVTVAGLGFLSAGAFIFYNTNILNDFKSKDDDKRVQASYESQFKQNEDNPSPRVTAVTAEVDFYPEQRRVDIRGTFDLCNKTDRFVEELQLNINPVLEIRSLSLNNGQILVDPSELDEDTGCRIYRLTEAIAPGRTMKLSFDLGADIEGFVNNDANAEIVANGSFINNLDYFPRVGYLSDVELTIPTDRRKQGLDPEWSMPSLDDPEALMTTFISDAEHITFEAVVSTSADQVAIAPGKLLTQWEQDGRRYFSYRMDEPILNFYSFLSGRYEVARESWNDVDLEVFYHHEHAFNVPRMLESMHSALDYCTANFSPYPFQQLRVVEFPRYRSFAQAFPGTVPFSESADFISDLRDTDNIDMVFYITAHEIAHQWWAHQLIPANVPGSQMITESLAQYTALMVMEKNMGPLRVGKFLAYELNRYLKGRGTERDEEVPLVREEGQPYIYYNKGSLVFYALRDYLGEDVVNDALQDFLLEFLDQGPPYATAPELLTRLRERTPEQFTYLIEDFFETITLYDNRTESATCTPTDDGRFRVVVNYVSHKYRADGQGVEEEVPHQDWIEVGVFSEGEDGQEIELGREKRRLASGRGQLEIIVDQEPKRAGIDPRNLLIDRVVDDNLKSVSMVSS